MRIGASAANSRQELGQGDKRFSFQGLGKKTLILGDFETHMLYPAVLHPNIKTSRTFDFSHAIQGEIKGMHIEISKIKNKNEKLS